MVVGACRMTLHVPASESLKDKRQVVRSVIARVRNEFNVAVAEVGGLDSWQIAEVGFVVLTNEHAHADEMMAKIVNFVERLRLDFDLGDYETELIDVF